MLPKKLFRGRFFGVSEWIYPQLNSNWRGEYTLVTLPYVPSIVLRTYRSDLILILDYSIAFCTSLSGVVCLHSTMDLTIANSLGSQQWNYLAIALGDFLNSFLQIINL